jgi:hypothetical protein
MHGPLKSPFQLVRLFYENLKSYYYSQTPPVPTVLWGGGGGGGACETFQPIKGYQ